MSMERLNDLLADKALAGALPPQEEAELAHLLSMYPHTNVASFEEAATAALLASIDSLELIPPHVAARARGENVVPLRPKTAPKKPSRVFAVMGWVAAAALLLLLIGSIAYPRFAGGPTATAQRTKLLKKPGVTKTEWTATTDPAGAQASGDVVWSAAEQRGYMRFKGLAKNDKAAFQYQLWIFDKNRDDKFPVDGGVFDVDNETGDVVVPIQAKLKVDEPVLFAVTVEKPGGVVVSKRERIVVTAKPTAG